MCCSCGRLPYCPWHYVTLARDRWHGCVLAQGWRVRSRANGGGEDYIAHAVSDAAAMVASVEPLLPVRNQARCAQAAAPCNLRACTNSRIRWPAGRRPISYGNSSDYVIFFGRTRRLMCTRWWKLSNIAIKALLCGKVEGGTRFVS